MQGVHSQGKSQGAGGDIFSRSGNFVSSQRTSRFQPEVREILIMQVYELRKMAVIMVI